MKFGLFDHLDCGNGNLTDSHEDRLQMEALCRRGFRASLFAQHHSTPSDRALSSNLFLSVVAQRARRLSFGLLAYVGRPKSVFHRCMPPTPAHGRSQVARITLPLFAAFILCGPVAVKAEDWPSRPVSLVVPYEPGGIVDLTARLLADHMAKMFPQPFIIENRAGAGGTIGTQYVARANPDGHTLLVASVAQIAIAPLVQNVKYDPLNDFVPISMFSSGVIALAVSTGVTTKTTADLIAYAKANPGKLSYSSAGFGSFSHLGGAMFTSRAGIELLHVPYKGALPAVQALLSDQVQVYVGNFAELQPLVQAGKLRLLALATRERLAQTPDLPTIAETLPGFQMAGWQGLLAPARTPPPIVSRLEQQAIAAARSPAAIARLRNLSVTAVGSTAAEFVAGIRKDIELYQRVTKAAGLEKQN